MLLLCCFCSIEFEIPHHCWWLWEILLLLTLRNANCRVEFNSRCSTYYISKSTLFKRKPEKKKIFSEMKINLIRSWHKYVIPNSRPFVIQLRNYSVFLKGIGNCLKITFYIQNDSFKSLKYKFFLHCFSFIYFQNAILHFQFPFLFITLVQIFHFPFNLFICIFLSLLSSLLLNFSSFFLIIARFIHLFMY